MDTANLAAALVKAQAEFPSIKRSKTVQVRTRTGGTYTFAYAPLEAILEATKPVLAKHGLSVQQDVTGEGAVYTIIRHASGEFVSLAGVKVTPTESTPQALGSALTYARRYSYCLALNLAADDDDDAGAAVGNETVEKKHLEGYPKEVVLPAAEMESLKELAAQLIEWVGEGSPESAYRAMQAQNLDADQKVALWTLLGPHSKVRSALKAEAAKK